MVPRPELWVTGMVVHADRGTKCETGAEEGQPAHLKHTVVYVGIPTAALAS